MSAWRAIYDSKDDQALITATGLNFVTFDWLAGQFDPYYESNSPWLDTVNGRILPRLEDMKALLLLG